MSLPQEKFDAAVKFIANRSGKIVVPNHLKLKIYALFKQITVGNNTAAKPWAINIEARAKWDAWEAQKGKTKVVCQLEYAKEVAQLSKVT